MARKSKPAKSGGNCGRRCGFPEFPRLTVPHSFAPVFACSLLRWFRCSDDRVLERSLVPSLVCRLRFPGGMPSPRPVSRLRVLVACEFSGVVREAFNRLGHDAWSCDLLATEIPGKHFRADALEVVGFREWDLIVAHPPCTYLTNSGVRWLYGKRGGSTVRDEARWAEMRAGADFFAALYHSKAPRVAVENPVMHGHAAAYLAAAGVPAFSQSIQPYQFGHLETKRTCLWLRGLPALIGTEDVEAAMRRLPKSETNRVHLAPPGPDRWAMRSRTFPGIAEAMAMQWGGRVSSAISVYHKDSVSTHIIP